MLLIMCNYILRIRKQNVSINCAPYLVENCFLYCNALVYNTQKDYIMKMTIYMNLYTGISIVTDYVQVNFTN